MDLFGTMAERAHDSLHLFHDPATGLRGIVSIHDTTLGPSLGGTRALSTYRNEGEAIRDAMRLSRGMTYKAALAGIAHGGGKAVIWLPQESFDRGALFTAFGRAVDSLGGRYITTEDSGTSTADMDFVREGTKHVVGMARERGGSGDPSPFTAFGVLRGIEAVAEGVLKRSDLAGLKVSILGVGHVGFPLARLLSQAGAKLWVADVNAAATARAREELGATVVEPEAIYDLDVDVFSPCALGGILNDETIPRLRCKAVAGAANNQLAEERHGAELARRRIAYAPDYAINAGGLINVAQELLGYDEARSKARCAQIKDTITGILERARAEETRPELVADRIVEERIAARRKR